MTYLEFVNLPQNFDDNGDPLRETIKDESGNLLADYDMDGETYPLEGVDEQRLLQREVVGVERHGHYMEVTLR